MRNFVLRFIITTIAGASAMAGASAQKPETDEDFLSELVRAVSGKTETVVSFGAPDVSKPHKKSTLLSALDFVTDAYEANDFYESGYWGKDGNTFSSDIYTGSLPSYSKKDFTRPVAGGDFTSMFGYREAHGRMHKGVDISLKEGDMVMAALPGVVGRIGYEPGGYGHFVVVIHSDGVETRYAHLSRITAVLGQKVAAGEVIALGGNTGNSTGPHLHFEVRKQGKAIDPLLVFSF